MAQSIPNENGFKQPNAGTGKGNLFATYNVDFQANKGVLQTSGGVVSEIDSTIDADFSGYAAQIVPMNGKYYAIGDELFKATTPTGNWGDILFSPDLANTVTDSVVFDDLLLFFDGDDIASYDGTTFDTSWWKTTRGQAALTTGKRFFMKVASDENLYIVDGGNKVYKVLSDGSGGGAITTTGEGTLDFSAREFDITCVENTSSRMFLGTTVEGGEAYVIEWDLGPQTNTPNRLHPIGGASVRAIAIWNDTPVALLADGNFKYFNGSSFVDYEGMQFPSANQNFILEDAFIHPNGWAIIDNLPHFLVTGRVENGGTTYSETESALWNMPAGVWCLDPEIGLYHRFAIGSGSSTQSDYGQLSVSAVGALMAVKDVNTKFLASYEYYSDASTSIPVLASHDMAKTNPYKTFFATVPAQTFEEVWKSVDSIIKRLSSGDQLDLYYRLYEEDSEVVGGTWADTDTFNTTDTTTVEVGNMALIKIGKGAGAWKRVSEVSTSTNTKSITFESTADFITAEDTGSLEIFNFKKLGSVTGTGQNNYSFTVPVTEKAHRLQLLCEVSTGAGKTNHVNYVIIN